jgi:hypothetical protein
LNHILVRQIIPSDEEQTPILEDMKDMQITSLNLKRKATIRLEYLTSLVGEKRPGETTPGCMAPAIRDSESSLELQSILLEPQSKSIVISSRSLATPGTRDIASHNVIGFMPSIDVNVVGSIIHNTSTPTTAPLDHFTDKSPTSTQNESATAKIVPKIENPALSSHALELELSNLLSSASFQHTGIKKLPSEETIIRIGNLFAVVGKYR